ncbi:MAG: NAD(P)/FAD-dependent oxidoreductase [Pseudomonadota bacterium]
MPKDDIATRYSDRDSPAVTVIGAGPAGLACAIVLARAGRRVLIREAHDRVGGRFHGDFQGLENWSSEEDVLDGLAAHGIMPRFDHHPVRAGVAFDAWGDRYRVASDRPIYYLVRRGSETGTLDRGLLAQALELGVDVRFGDRAQRADGPAILAGGPRVADAIAVGYVFDTDMADGNWIAFDDALAPLGYSYLLVHAGRGTVAACMFSGFKQEAEYVARTVEMFRERVGLSMRNAKPFGGFANFRLPRRAIQGGHLVVGEQAGFQDALAGFGMRYAMESGVLAARSLIEGLSYPALWRRNLLPRIRASVTNRMAFELAGARGRRWVLSRRLAKGDVRDGLRRIYRASLVSAFLFPIAHWRYRKRLKDPSCDHVDCSCVWCRCGGARAGLQVQPG